MHTLLLSAFIVLIFSPLQIRAQYDPIKTQHGDVDSTVYEFVEEMPQFPGGKQAYHEFVKKRLKWPRKATQKGVHARVVVSFIIEKDGTTSDFKIIKGAGLGFDEVVLKSLRGMPVWTPGKENGRNVRVKDEGVFSFQNGRSIAEQNIEEGYTAYPHIEQMPEFPGGEKAFFEFILNVKSSEEAKRFGVHGTVLASFVINEEGTPVEFKITRGLGFGLDEEAMDLLQPMPEWTPGMHNGQNVRVKYYVPINFKLNQ